MNWEQLLELAEAIANPPQHGEARGRPQQTHLRKATSIAYYAMFHALANSNADMRKFLNSPSAGPDDEIRHSAC